MTPTKFAAIPYIIRLQNWALEKYSLGKSNSRLHSFVPDIQIQTLKRALTCSQPTQVLQLLSISYIIKTIASQARALLIHTNWAYKQAVLSMRPQKFRYVSENRSKATRMYQTRRCFCCYWMSHLFQLMMTSSCFHNQMITCKTVNNIYRNIYSSHFTHGTLSSLKIDSRRRILGKTRLADV